jgi:hypothetical protein
VICFTCKVQQYLLVEKDNGLAPFIPWVSSSSETDEIISASKLVLPLSLKECNYGLRATLSASRLTKLLVNNIHIYSSKLIYYENTFHNNLMIFILYYK